MTLSLKLTFWIEKVVTVAIVAAQGGHHKSGTTKGLFKNSSGNLVLTF